LNASAGTRILATSREPLGLDTERLYRLGPLPLLGDHDVLTAETLTGNPAVAMFLDRAQLRGEELRVDGDDAEQIVELCRTLEGLPLALELAAGRVSAFGLADLVGLLDRRLDVLGDSSSGREHRHRTLRSTVEWSYDLLDDDERRLFRSLAVFPAGVAIDAIDWLADRLSLGVSGPEAAARLVDASLLVRHRTPSGSRYTLLETLRAYGLEQLEASDELDTVREFAAAFTLDLLRRAEAGLRSPDEARWVDRVRRELPNLQMTRAHLAPFDRTDELLEMSRRLVGWTRLRDATEVWAWSDDLLDRCAADDPRRATALALHAQAAWRRGDVARAIEDATTALANGADDWTDRQAKSELGAALLFTGDLVGAQTVWTGLSGGDDDAWALGSAAVAAAYSGDIGVARDHVARAHELARAAPSPSMTAWTDFCAVEVENTVGSADLTALDRAIDQARGVDATFIVGVALLTAASVHVARGNTDEAARRYTALIRHWLRSGSWVQMWTTLRHAAELLEESHPETSLAILRAAGADRLSPPALIDASSDRLAALAARLEARVGSEVEDGLTRVEVAERALTALSERS
jgi:predicted ATPase